MQTRNVLFSVVLCALAQAGIAECERAPQSAAAPDRGGIHKVAAADPASGAGGPNKLGGMLIKNADASQPQGRAQPASLQTTSMQRQPAAEDAADPEGQPRTTTAMLLAALAVMLAIALRRTGAED